MDVDKGQGMHIVQVKRDLVPVSVSFVVPKYSAWASSKREATAAPHLFGLGLGVQVRVWIRVVRPGLDLVAALFCLRQPRPQLWPHLRRIG